MEGLNVCRICIDNEDLIPIFPLRFGVPDMNKILIATGIEVNESDDLPHFLCPACLKFIDEVDYMRQKAEESDALLRKLFYPGQPDPESEDVLRSLPDHQESESEQYGFRIEYLDETEIHTEEMAPESVPTAGKYGSSPSCKDEVIDIPEPVVRSRRKPDHIELKFSKVVFLEPNEMLPASCTQKRPVTDMKRQSDKPVVQKHQAYVCEICGKEMKRRARYYEHLNTHNNARPYQCNICPLNFNARANLNRHKLVHTGEKPYKCNMCPNSYRATHHLKYHKLQKHGSKDDIKFQCLKCDKSFPQNFLLTAHMKQHFARTGRHATQD